MRFRSKHVKKIIRHLRQTILLGFSVLVLPFVAIETSTHAFVRLVASLHALRTVRVHFVVYSMIPRRASRAFSPVVAEFARSAERAVDGSVQRRYTITGTCDTSVDLSVVLVLVLSWLALLTLILKVLALHAA